MALTLNGTTGISGIAGSAGTPALQGNNDTNTGYFFTTDTLGLSTAGSERLRIDSSGRLLVGTSTGRSAGGVTAQLQVEGTSYNTSSLNLIINTNDANPSYISLSKSRGTSDGSSTVVQDGDYLGLIQWCGADGTDINSRGAEIFVQVDGSPGSNDLPGRLVFGTTADGNAAPTERLRIDSSGRVIITNDSVTHSTGTNTQYAPLVVRGNTSATSSRAAFINFARSEASANIAVNEGIGEIWFGDQQAGEYGAIKCIADGTAAVGDYPGRLSFHTTADGGTTMSERLRITSNGDIRQQWNDGNFFGSYYDADYYMGFTFGATARTLYIDNRSNDTRADIVFRNKLGQSTPEERLRIDANGDVQIGTTTPITAYSSGGNKLTVFKADGNGGVLELGSSTNLNAYNAGMILFYNNTNANATQWQADSKLVGLFRAEIITTDNNAGDDCGADLTFYTKPEAGAGSLAMTIHGEGNVSIDDGNLVLANGHGVDFSASEGGNGTSNEASVLDDYEEGTWTAALVTGTATHDKTTYRKIGSVVHLWGRLYSPSDTTSSNSVIITGLPFAVADGTAVGSCMAKDVSNKETLTTFVNTAEHLYFYGIQNSNAWNSMLHSNFGANVEVYYHATYWTTA
jgi:hypothetical protein